MWISELGFRDIIYIRKYAIPTILVTDSMNVRNILASMNAWETTSQGG